MGGGNNANTNDEGTHANNALSQLKRKAQTKVKEFIHSTAQAKGREHVERELSIGGDGSGGHRTAGKHALACTCGGLGDVV